MKHGIYLYSSLLIIYEKCLLDMCGVHISNFEKMNTCHKKKLLFIFILITKYNIYFSMSNSFNKINFTEKRRKWVFHWIRSQESGQKLSQRTALNRMGDEKPFKTSKIFIASDFSL